ncbi:MAG: Gfo/Idh/MocA family oxidoreductase [Caldilineaceae bacterium]
MTIQLALIGCGGIARRHVLSMKDLQERGCGDFIITAVCDANEANAREKADMFEELFGVRPTVYTDHRALIQTAGSMPWICVCPTGCTTVSLSTVWKAAGCSL